MGGHAYNEVMEDLTMADVIVLAVLVILLFLAGIYLLRQLRRQCIKYIQNEIRREVEAAALQQQTVKIV